MCQDLAEYKYPHQPKRFPEIMMCLPEIRHIAGEYIQFIQLSPYNANPFQLRLIAIFIVRCAICIMHMAIRNVYSVYDMGNVQCVYYVMCSVYFCIQHNVSKVKVHPILF